MADQENYYTSEYTGEEIDELLSKINTLYTILYSGNEDAILISKNQTPQWQSIPRAEEVNI